MKIKKLLKFNQAGFGHFEAVLAIAVIVMVGAVGVYISNHNHSHAASPTTTPIGTSSFPKINKTLANPKLPESSNALPDLTLDSGTCTSSSVCLVGGQNTNNSAGIYLTKNSGDSWESISLPNFVNNYASGIDWMTCSSSTNCLAVGEYFISASPYTLILYSTNGGNSWQVIKSPISGGYAQSVSCSSATQCMAIIHGTETQGIIVSEDGGSSWSAVTLPTIAISGLQSISCAWGSNICSLIGTNGAGYWVISSTNNEGSSWSTQVFKGAQLYSIVCPSSGSCVAVGQNQQLDPIAAVTNNAGVDWQTIDVSNNPIALVGVACLSNNSCVAGGFFNANIDQLDSAIFTSSNNGTSWSKVLTLPESDDIQWMMTAGKSTYVGGVFQKPKTIWSNDGGKSWVAKKMTYN